MTGSERKTELGIEGATESSATIGPGVWLSESLSAASRRCKLPADDERTLRILLLIQDADFGDCLLDELRSKDASVALSRKGRDGLTLARSGLVDVVISEMELPDLPGLALLSELASMSKMPKVILTTNRHSQVLAERAIERGASAVLGKPFRVDQLLALLTQLLGN